MRYFFVKHLMCLLLLFFWCACSSSQTITTQKGLTTAVFNTSNGKIKVYLPDDMRAGDTISGRIVSEPDGKNARQTEKNIAELKKYSINISTEKYSIDNADKTFQLKVSDRTITGSIELINVSGIKAGEITIPMQTMNQEFASGKCVIPSHALTGSPLQINGPFDGDASNTKCSLDNKPLEILAESPRQCIVLYPSDAKGIQTLNVQEKNQEACVQKVSGVQMNISAGKLSLLKGERTYIIVNITGLQNLPDTAFLTLDNITANVVAMQPMNHIIIPLAPDSVGSGVFNKRFDIRSIKKGDFTVTVNLDLPDVLMDQKPVDNVKKLEDSLKKKKDELEQKKRERDITIDDEIKKAEKGKRDCDKELEEVKKKAAAAAEALDKAKQKKDNIEKNIGPGKAFPDKEAAKKNFGDYEKEYNDAKDASDKANINLTGLKKKCPELTKALTDLKNRKTVALPGEIEKGEKEVKKLEDELEREKTKAEEEKKKVEDEKKKAEEEQRQKTQALKDAEDAKYKTKAENIYLLQNIYSLGLISSKIWETPGLLDWLPDILEKPVGDAAEELVKTPIPLDAITAVAALYNVVAAKLDPCTAEGSITTIGRLKGMKNTKTDRVYTDTEAMDKTDKMCELLNKLKAIAAAAKKKK